MVIPPVSAVNAVVAPTATSSTAATASTESNAFAKGLESAQKSIDTADTLSQQLATGQLQDLHQYMAAATKANLSLSLTVAIRDKAVEAYQEVMRMQI